MIKEGLVITIYATKTCPSCIAAIDLFLSEGVPVESIVKIYVDIDPVIRERMLNLSGGRRTVPQIFIGDRHIGGHSDLVACKRAGDLQSLLSDND